MKKLYYLMLGLVLLAGCHKDGKDNEPVIGKDFAVDASGNIEVEMIYVKGGTFQMGAAEDDEEADDKEKPAHEVTLTEDFYIGTYPVTQGFWNYVMGTTIEEQRDKGDKGLPLFGVGFDYPMYYVSWEEAQEFCTRLSKLTGKNYALPTEAQWEYAARGGEKSEGYKYSGSDDIDEVAWYGEEEEENEMGSTHPVGTKNANELGIYDMSGNVFEWCQDWFAWDYYANSQQTDPVGPETGFNHVVRGGSGCDFEGYCRVSYRNYAASDDRSYYYGFRLVLLP